MASPPFDEFESVRSDPDPIKRGQRASELITIYQQRSVELARLRKAAIEEARRSSNMSYTEIAAALGITKGRVTQIRSTAPRPERAFFGVGPLEIALPGRIIREREDVVIASEDDATGAYLTVELEKLAFSVADRVLIDPREEWEPKGDAVVVCGPASAHIGHKLMGEDPFLTMTLGDNAQWYIVDRITGGRYLSPMDDVNPIRADHAYIARRKLGNHVIVHIAGLHALGSVGAAHYLITALPELFAEFGDSEFSMAVTGEFEGLAPKKISVLAPVRVWS
ncbi:helix-turn-helix domain-containing protein [Umezawaea beigongshangensis]|uniref:helix-turn-helix domain-containing protein n=1 Tax=Umezawaea beigongshangensis TaxID=2780383 RepID=UPI0018F10DDD|nr:helix-turn-helix transcriptional regulator [Umezawaea beigongshangensis]